MMDTAFGDAVGIPQVVVHTYSAGVQQVDPQDWDDLCIPNDELLAVGFSLKRN